MSVTVNIDLLERVFAILLQHLREVVGDQVDLPFDHFWSLPADQTRDVYNEPHDFTIGQLSESLEWLIAIDSDGGRALNHDLIYLADLLRAIGMTAKG